MFDPGLRLRVARRSINPIFYENVRSNMSAEAIQTDLRRKVARPCDLTEEGVDRYPACLPPFLFEDGDHLAIVIRREDQPLGSLGRRPYVHASDVRPRREGSPKG